MRRLLDNTEAQDIRERRAQKIADGQAILAQRGEEAFTAFEGRCKDPDRLLDSVRAFVKRELPEDATRPLYGGSVEKTLGGIPTQYEVFATIQNGFAHLPIGHVELEPAGDDFHRFKVVCFAGDPSGYWDHKPAREFFKALAGYLQNIYGSDDAAQLAASRATDANDKQTATAPAERQDGRGKKEKRERGPSPDILDSCKEAMSDWLDKSRPLRTSAETAGVSKETVLRWIPNVLVLIDDEPKRSRWIQLIKAQRKAKHLGEFGEV